MEYRLASASAAKLQAVPPRSAGTNPRSITPADNAHVDRNATIPWQSAQPPNQVEAIDPDGTACQPVHRNGVLKQLHRFMRTARWRQNKK
jgi:hypothetical protein